MTKHAGQYPRISCLTNDATLQELHINNTQYALLDGSQDFMVTALILVSGLVTDKIGGAGEFSS